jgi:DNA repair exonuclease SbcCD ATPase subunit
MKNLEKDFKELKDLIKDEEEKVIDFGKKVKQEVIDRWENLGFLEGLEEDTKKVVAQAFEYAAEYLSFKIIKDEIESGIRPFELKAKVDGENLKALVKKILEEADNAVKDDFKKLFDKDSATREDLNKIGIDIEPEFVAKYFEYFDTKTFEK